MRTETVAHFVSGRSEISARKPLRRSECSSGHLERWWYAPSVPCGRGAILSATMGVTADPAVYQLVTELCATLPTFGGDEALEDEACVDFVTGMEMGFSVSHDQVLAGLLDMGYDIEVASRAIVDCGRLDVAAIIEHMTAEAPISVPMQDAPVIPSTCNWKVPSSSTRVKMEEGEEQVFSLGTRLAYPRKASFEASTSGAHSSVVDQDELDDPEFARPRKHSLSSKGNLAMSARPEEDDDFDIGKVSDRWVCDDPETDKEQQLLRLGFSPQDVTDAFEACGVDSDVNEIANHIINNTVDLPETNWDGYDTELDMVDVVHPKSVKKEDFENGSGFPDQGRLILNKLRSMGLGFTAKMVVEAFQACGKDAGEDALVDYLLRTDESSLPVAENSSEALRVTKLEQLKQLGCISTAACLRAIDNNGHADVDELLDYYYAEEWQNDVGGEDGHHGHITTTSKKRKMKESYNSTKLSRLLQRKERRVEFSEEDEQEDDCPRYHRNLTGFGLPGEPLIPRSLSEDISRPPYFYFENVAYTPKDEWNNIKRHLYNIEPEFVDSLNFSPCRRPRGYIHNLPLQGRVNILPKPPMTVQELIPGAAEFWPAWDNRVKLNTINTRAASEFVRRQIQDCLTSMENGEISVKDIKTIMYWVKRWNLVWVSPGVPAPLSPEEIERCLGFDVRHTRVLYSLCDRVRVLGNSFQVNTVAYHLSVLRPLYGSGIRVLSLFSGIGGAEVALHKLGIFLKLVVSVEIDDKSRMVVDSWWKSTNQKGTLIHSFKDVREVDSRAIQSFVDKFGGFDLVIGGSPCNNLSGNNRCTRVGLAGSASVTFFEFPRILADVRDFMAKKRKS